MGASSGITFSHSSGKRILISLTTAGQAELMIGFFSLFSFIRLRVASLTSSAARLTSNTSSKPSCFKPVSTMSMLSKLLNCPNNAGAGMATV